MQLELAEPRQERTAARPDHILVVDDESSVITLVVAWLEQAGYDVSAASDADHAMMHLQDDPGCDLVLSDVMMPGCDGLTLLDHIGRDHCSVPVVMLTGVQDVQVAANAFRRGAIDYLVKPFDRTQLLTVVSRALDHSRLMKQNEAYRQNLEEIISNRTSRLRATMLDLERSYDFTLEAMGDALDLRDAETEGHSRRVTAYTIALAREMGLTHNQIRVIARGAFLHDIGKIATPDRILLKPGKLDPEETAIMREHCERGYEMVRKIPFLREAAEIVHTHQETFDGTGYPRGLSGEDIPLGARIFAIADTLDAITSDRPYRKGRSFAEARAEIVRCSGTQFDPAIVQVFLGISDDVWTRLREEVHSGTSSGLNPRLD
ncbi:MAG TPA: HD domain-containing phosphohydrolase [Acidobacteriaceae bacterium]|nr:HD domain-containing phosphohydrolase [Acidobacteriaceae bacterium]